MHEFMRVRRSSGDELFISVVPFSMSDKLVVIATSSSALFSPVIALKSFVASSFSFAFNSPLPRDLQKAVVEGAAKPVNGGCPV